MHILYMHAGTIIIILSVYNAIFIEFHLNSAISGSVSSTHAYIIINIRICMQRAYIDAH